MVFPSDPVIKAILAPLAVHYAPSGVIEVRMSQPKRVTIEARGTDKIAVEDAALTLARLKRICTNLANRNGILFNGDNRPRVSCRLPGGHRFECLVGSSAEDGVSLAIRCKHPFQAEFGDYGLDDARARQIVEFVLEGRHILVSGGTNTGKTTLLNLLLRQLPDTTRLVLAQDTPEIDRGRFADCSSLLAGRGGDSPSMLSWQEVYDHINRITPDRVLFGAEQWRKWIYVYHPRRKRTAGD